MSNSTLMRRWIETVVRHRVGFLIAAIIITGALVSRIGHLRIEIDPNRFLPQSHPYVITSNRVEDLFGSRYVLAIGITPQTGSVYEPEILGKVARITAKLREVPGVVKTNILSFSARKAKSITGTADGMEVLPLMGAVPATESEAQAVRRRVESNPAYRDIIVSGDQRSVAVLAEFIESQRSVLLSPRGGTSSTAGVAGSGRIHRIGIRGHVAAVRSYRSRHYASYRRSVAE